MTTIAMAIAIASTNKRPEERIEMIETFITIENLESSSSEQKYSPPKELHVEESLHPKHKIVRPDKTCDETNQRDESLDASRRV